MHPVGGAARVYRGALQCVAVCCSVLPVCCTHLEIIPSDQLHTHEHGVRGAAVTLVCCSVLQCVAAGCQCVVLT